MVNIPRSFYSSSLLLSGGTGPFGLAVLSHLDRFKARGEIYILSRKEEKVLKLINLFPNLNIRYIYYDFLKHSWYQIRLLPSCDFVLHMASVTAEESFNRIDPYEKYLVLQKGAAFLLDYCQTYKVKSVVFTSTGAIYGEYSGFNNIKETELLKVMIDDPERYSLIMGKLAAEFTVAYISKYTATKAKIARCFGICGPGIPTDLHYAIGNFAKQALEGNEIIVKSDGQAVRSFMDTRDLATWLVSLLSVDMPDLIYNVGSDEAVKIRDLAKMMVDISGSKGSYRIEGRINDRLSNPQVSYYVPSIAKARGDGLDLQYGLAESIKMYLSWLELRS